MSHDHFMAPNRHFCPEVLSPVDESMFLFPGISSAKGSSWAVRLIILCRSHSYAVGAVAPWKRVTSLAATSVPAQVRTLVGEAISCCPTRETDENEQHRQEVVI
eukprot:1258804-Rhodomonas_salina.1